MNLIDRLRDLWPHDDSPGYTDYAENDIRAHRANAKLMGRFAYLGLAAGIISGAYYNSIPTAAAGIGWFFIAEYAAISLRLQAVEWEAQLLKEDD